MSRQDSILTTARMIMGGSGEISEKQKANDEAFTRFIRQYYSLDKKEEAASGN